MNAPSGIRTHDSNAGVTEGIAPTCWPRCTPEDLKNTKCGRWPWNGAMSYGQHVWARTCCHTDGVQLHQETSRQCEPPTEPRVTPNWRTRCNVKVLISRGNFGYTQSCCNMSTIHFATHTLFMFAVKYSLWMQIIFFNAAETLAFTMRAANCTLCR